jgi:hypothetical protein
MHEDEREVLSIEEEREEEANEGENNAESRSQQVRDSLLSVPI